MGHFVDKLLAGTQPVGLTESASTTESDFVRAPGRIRTAAVVSIVAVVGVGGASTSAGASKTDAPTPVIRLGGSVHGSAALSALGAKLSASASANKMSAQRLRSLLTSDLNMWLDSDAKLYAVDPAPAQAARSSTPVPVVRPAAPYPASQTFQLHSRPGSQRTIYLDFDGATVSGTAWNSNKGAPNTLYPPFDTDGSPSTFGTAERDLVQSVWQRVSEDYAPFDIDVTTQDPGVNALTRTSSSDSTYGAHALITPSATARTAVCGGGCGGVAYVGTFNAAGNARYQPTWIFPQSLGNSAKAIAEATSHEVGHTLGLLHDGVVGGTAYYAGQGNWAPIMGIGYNKPIVQFSKGEYNGANNTQDDLAVIAAHGAPLAADDVGDTATTASSLGPGTVLSGAGLINSALDTDWFSFSTTCTGTANISVGPAPVSPDLDTELSVYDGRGTVLGAWDAPTSQTSSDVASGLSAALTGTLPPGTYYLRVRGVGSGNPATTGYSTYDSLGRYTVRATTAGSAC
jgi:hypothetical protein